MTSNLTIRSCYYQREGTLIGPVSVEEIQRLVDVGTIQPSDEIDGDQLGDDAFGPLERPRLRVLIVDDNKDGADSLAMLVTSWDHDVGVAYDGDSALLAAADCMPDVVLLDLGMPQPDGFQVAQHLLEKDGFKDVLVIAISGYTDQAHRSRAVAAGISYYLIKPTEPEIIKKLLAMRRKLIKK